jgi:hypothetical protein
MEPVDREIDAHGLLKRRCFAESRGQAIGFEAPCDGERNATSPRLIHGSHRTRTAVAIRGAVR